MLIELGRFDEAESVIDRAQGLVEDNGVQKVRIDLTCFPGIKRSELRSDLGSERGQWLNAAGYQVDARSLLREGARHVLPDPPGGAVDHRVLAFEEIVGHRRTILPWREPLQCEPLTPSVTG